MSSLRGTTPKALHGAAGTPAPIVPGVMRAVHFEADFKRGREKAREGKKQQR